MDGVDLMLDTDLNLWFLEVVGSPGVKADNQDFNVYTELLKIRMALKNDEDID